MTVKEAPRQTARRPQARAAARPPAALAAARPPALAPAHPDAPLEPEALLQLQRSVGNQVVSRMLRAPADAPLLQRAWGEAEEAIKAAQIFRKLSGDEMEIIADVNELLLSFSRSMLQSTFALLQQVIARAIDQIEAIHGKHQQIVDDYLDSAPKLQSLFMATYDNGDELAEARKQVFDQIARATKDNAPKLRARFLSYTLQGLSYTQGFERLLSFVELLGDRTIELDQLPQNMMAGLSDGGDQEKSVRVDRSETAKRLDQDFRTSKKSLQDFLLSLKQDKREENPQAQGIGNVSVVLDKSATGVVPPLFPIYGGEQDGEATLYSAPKHTAIHHELGHVINYLEGKGSTGKEHTFEPGSLLAQAQNTEEIYNLVNNPAGDYQYHKSLGLPGRTSYNTFISNPLAESRGSMAGMVKKLQLSQVSPQSVIADLRKEILYLASKDWSPYLSTGATPDGVLAIRAAIRSKKDDMDAVRAAKLAAMDFAFGAPPKKDKFTQVFYNLIVEIKPFPDLYKESELLRLQETTEALKAFGRQHLLPRLVLPPDNQVFSQPGLAITNDDL